MEKFSDYPNNRGENWIAFREAPDFKEGIRLLEDSVIFSTQDKLLILAVALNLKKAAEFDVRRELSSEEEIENVLSKLGVYFHRSTQTNERIDEWLRQSNDSQTDDSLYYLISSTPNSMNEAIEKAKVLPDNRQAHNDRGEAMEFPETAITAWEKYVTDQDKTVLLDPNDERLSDEEKAFSFFRMSSNNWENEIVWLEQIIAGIKKYSPAIYEEVMRNH